jgi:hypothetical protein
MLNIEILGLLRAKVERWEGVTALAVVAAIVLIVALVFAP